MGNVSSKAELCLAALLHYLAGAGKSVLM